VSRKRDREIAEEIRDMIALGDPNWRRAALAHLKQMMQHPDSAKTIAGVIKVLSERTKKS
jgi:hypothetical protein